MFVGHMSSEALYTDYSFTADWACIWILFSMNDFIVIIEVETAFESKSTFTTLKNFSAWILDVKIQNLE